MESEYHGRNRRRVVVLGVLAVAGFCLRYRHYERRYRTEVLRASDLLANTHHTKPTD